MFTREIFVSNGWHEMGLNGRPNPTPTLFQGHCEKAGQCVQALELSGRMPIVMPLRHPYRVEESWKRRGEDTKRMQQAYNHMLKVMRRDVAVWLPIDAWPSVRSEQHRRLNQMAGKQLKVDWNDVVNGEHATHAVELSTLDPSDYIRHIRRDRLFVRYYGEAD
jgi:hypothetical protein